MNRQERRRISKGKRIPFKQLVPMYEPPDRSKIEWCPGHTLKLDNIDEPTERDKRLIESVRLIPQKTVGENGIIKLVKVCPRCRRSYPIKIEGAPEIEVFTVK